MTEGAALIGSSTQVVDVPTPSQAYKVVVGHDILHMLGATMQGEVGGDRVFVVTDTNVCTLYLKRVMQCLEDAGYETSSLTVPAGEQHKDLATFGLVVEAMANANLTRSSVVVALGGGVVGDMAGFAAACYMRGIPVVQVPTTLLAMVDSSVGGKTAIDLCLGKNLVGAFHQPSLVLADVSCLASLDHEVFVDGVGEVVKHAVLADASLFEMLSSHKLPQDSDLSALVQVVSRNVEIKRDVVSADERERGLRQTLNLGHTIGHAVEAAGNFALGHGHCVSIGLGCIARASEALGWSNAGLADSIERCLAMQGLPTDTDIDHDTLFEFATHDKKLRAGSMSIAVPRDIGDVILRDVSLEELRTIIELGCGTGV